MHIARKFESFLDRYRREDGGRWTGQDLNDATGGVVTRSYVSTLRKGRIENPGFDKLRAIAKAMGFPPELWFEEGGELNEETRVERADEGSSLSRRVEHLFETAGNGRTGEPYTDAEIARLTLGDLTEEEVAGIRNGRLKDPTVSQILALSDVFGISPTYFLDRGREQPHVDEESLRALGDEKSRLLLRKSLGLSEREKDMIIDMIEHLANLRGSNETV